MSSVICCVQKILDFGCDTNYRQPGGYTPLHHSCRYDLDFKIVKALLDRGADRDAKTVLGHTPLMIATFNKRITVAKLLIDSQVDLDIQGKDGGCALHYAVMVGDHSTVRHLLRQRANHRLKTNDGETLLHLAAQRNGDQEIIRILESFNLEDMDVEDKNRSQKLTALQVAEMHHGYDADWLEMFRTFIRKIKLRYST